MYRKGDDVYYTPDELGYQDRGMVKWQGFILSDHNELMEEYAAENRYVPPKPYQSLEKRAELVAGAFTTKRKVAIQLDYIENGSYSKEQHGSVRHVEGGRIWFETADGMRLIDMEQIRHVSFLDSTKWYFSDD